MKIDFETSQQREIIVFGTTLNEKTGILLNLLSNIYKITFICPIYETLNGIEKYNTNLFGQIKYTGENLFIDQLNIYVGIHESYIENVHLILCHNFDIFKRKPDEYYEQYGRYGLPNILQNQQNEEDSSELFLQRAIILKTCCEKLILQRKYQISPQVQNISYPKFIISMDSFSIISALYVKNYFSNINDITSVIIPQELSQSDQYLSKYEINIVMIYLTNYKNIFLNKNDLKGYKITDYNYCLRLLNILHIDINDITDKYVYNRLFPLRLALIQIDNIVTDQHTEEQINKSQLYNWISYENFVVDDNMRGLLDIEQEFKI